MNFYFKYQIPIFIGTIAANHIYHHHNQIYYYVGLKPLSEPRTIHNIESIDLKSFVSKSYEADIDAHINEVEKHAAKKNPITYMNDFIYQGDYTVEKHNEQNGPKEKFRLNGKGVLTNQDGSFKMVGTFKDNYLDGPGYLALPDGSTTKCVFQNGKLRGIGVINLQDLEYRGNIEGGAPKGSGVFLFKDGGSTVITFDEKEKKEIAKSYNKEGNLYYVGDTKKGAPEGNGEWVYSNGNIYRGQFIKGFKEGDGVLYDKFGDVIYKGPFQNDVPKWKWLLFKEPMISLGLTVLNGSLFLWKSFK